MKIIDKYIIKTIFSNIIAVAFIWIIIFSFFNLLRDIDNIGNYDYGFFNSIYVLLLNIPYILYQGIIAIMLIGTILALGNLANTSQIIVMRSVSISVLMVIKIVVLSVLFLFFLLAALSETLIPYFSEHSQQYKSKLLNKSDTKTSVDNFWLKDGQLILNAGKNYDGKNFAKVKLLSIENNKLTTVTTAERMAIAQNQAILGDAGSYAIYDEYIKYEPHAIKKINLLFNQHLIEKLKKDPLDLSIVDIYQQVKFLNKNNLNSSYFEVEMFKRTVRPILLITTVLFAMLFIFGSMRNSSMGKKLFLGVAISLVLELYLRVSGALVLKFNYNYFVIVLTPIVLFLCVNLYILFKKT